MTSPRRLPAEWEPQSAIMLTWPHQYTDWVDQLAEVETVYITLCRQISRHQRLVIICYDSAHKQYIQGLLLTAEIDVTTTCLIVSPSNDTWARDHGPLTPLEEKQAVLLDFLFNGWGGKYPASLDNKITTNMSQTFPFKQASVKSIELVLEGGAIETDGQGTLLATRSSVLSESRNPGLSQSNIEGRLQQELGFKHFLWLNHGQLSGDDTDGHIDTLARFTDTKTILYATAYPEDADYAELKAMEHELMQFRTPAGKPYRLIPLPPVSPIFDVNDAQLPAGYANFLIVNGAILLPVYSDPNDQAAITCLKECFPTREIIPIDCLPLIRQNGSLHCITMQFPAELELN